MINRCHTILIVNINHKRPNSIIELLCYGVVLIGEHKTIGTIVKSIMCGKVSYIIIFTTAQERKTVAL
jgi:hypothetical protein